MTAASTVPAAASRQSMTTPRASSQRPEHRRSRPRVDSQPAQPRPAAPRGGAEADAAHESGLEALRAAWRRSLAEGPQRSPQAQARLRRWMDVSADLTIEETVEDSTPVTGASGQRLLRVVVRRPTDFELGWLRSNCGPHLEEVVRSVLGPQTQVHYVAGPPASPPQVSTVPSDPMPEATPAMQRQGPVSSLAPGCGMPGIVGATPARPSFEEFVVGSSNELAYRAALRFVEPGGGAASLFIDGACGVGKTHLLRAICNRRGELDHRSQVLYTTGESFTNEFITALRNHQLEGFRARIRRLDLLAIDDVHFLADKNRTSSEFLHTIDHIGRHCKQVVLASDAPLDRLQAFSHALRSRLKEGVLVHIDLPDPALRLALVRRLAERRGLKLSAAAEAFLASRVEGTAREIEGALHRLAIQIQLGGQAQPPVNDEVDGATAALALRDLAGDRGAPLRPQSIVGAVCALLRIDRSDLLGRSRHPQVVLGRMLVTAAARRCTTLSFPEIGKLLGRAAHSTVHHAWTRASGLMVSGERIADAVETGPTTFSELLEQVKRIARRPG